MPPSTEDLFGPLEPKPFESLVSNEQILKALDSPGSPFETEQRLIHERLQTVYRDLPASLRDVWASCAKVSRVVMLCGSTDHLHLRCTQSGTTLFSKTSAIRLNKFGRTPSKLPHGYKHRFRFEKEIEVRGHCVQR